MLVYSQPQHLGSIRVLSASGDSFIERALTPIDTQKIISLCFLTIEYYNNKEISR